MKKTIIAQVSVKEDNVADFEAAADLVVKGANQEAGCITYKLLKDLSDSTTFFFYEEYEDDAAIEAHNSSAHFHAFVKAIKPLLSQDLIVNKY